MCVLVLTDACLPALEQQCPEAAHVLVNFDLPRAGMHTTHTRMSSRGGCDDTTKPSARASMVLPRTPGPCVSRLRRTEHAPARDVGGRGVAGCS